MKINTTIADIKRSAKPNGQIITKITTGDGKIIFARPENVTKVEGITVGQSVEITAHEETTAKGTVLVLDDIQAAENKPEAVPQQQAQTTTTPAQPEKKEVTVDALIVKITEQDSHGKRYWRIEDDKIGVIYCTDEFLMSFEVGDLCEITASINEKGAHMLKAVKVIKAAEKPAQKAEQAKPQTATPPTPPAPPKAETSKAAEVKQPELPKAEQTPTAPPKPETTVKAPEPPKPQPVPPAQSEKKQEAPKPAPAPTQVNPPAPPKTATAPKTVKEEKASKPEVPDDNPNMKIYFKGRKVPKEAQRAFNNGRFSGTDISPMWRIKCLTEIFGPCGIGWYTTVDKQWMEANELTGEVKAFVNLSLFVKYQGEWSKPIYGTGGNSFVAANRNGQPYVDDEAYKKAFTDALGSACKLLGIGADVYWSADSDSKYQ